MEGLQGEAFWHWCETNGYRHILDQYTYRNLIFGLLSDMCHFIYEGLKCSEEGKLSVAFSISLQRLRVGARKQEEFTR